MSNDSGLTIWVRDIDGYVDIDAINHEHRLEARANAVQAELDGLGEIKLLAGKSIYGHALNVPIEEWRWALSRAEQAIVALDTWATLERVFVSELIAMGRRYAISRYAKWERLTYPSAITATLPLGLKALISQFLVAEGIANTSWVRDTIQTALDATQGASFITAYARAAQLQSALHRIADATSDHAGARELDREGMRTILSLARLHFSVGEAKVGSLHELRVLIDAYEVERNLAANSQQGRSATSGHLIRAWPVRHLRPLVDLYPYAIRNMFSRALHHLQEVAELPDRAIVVNELALAHCGILRMRRAGRSRTRAA